MYILKFAKMYDNIIFQKYNEKTVPEDYYKTQGPIFCVADGVTRDSIYGQAVPYPKTEEEVKEWVKVYPKKSGAYEAAKICGDYFVKYASEYKKEEINEEIILKIVEKVNQKIWEINEGRTIDYVANDLFCCVAVGGYIVDNTLYCFSIGDCHITALNENLDVKFTTINNHKPFEEYLDNVYAKNHKFDWDKAEDRAMVRRDYRNKPGKKYEGKEITFGALSGEKEAMHYVDVYKVDLKGVKYICAYSDGCEPFFDDKEKLREIITDPERLQNEGKERTLAIYEEER